jgi:dTDP-glucose 4,6-dehydratase
MRIALTGASGFIGSVIARHLHESGHQVTALLRTSSKRDHVMPYLDRVIDGAIDDRAAFEPLLDGADALVHSAVDWKAILHGNLPDHLDCNLTASIELLGMAAAKSQRVVFMSSVAVHHHMSDRWNGLVDDEHPLRPGTMYGALKASLEAHLWALHETHALKFVSLRPAAVYGIDPNIERAIGTPILRSVAAGQPYERPGGGKFVHVDDVAAVTLASLQQPLERPGIYHLADCYARWCDWATMACELLGTHVSIDDRSPTAPKNMFDNTQMEQALGIRLERGHGGIRRHLEALHALLASESDSSSK